MCNSCHTSHVTIVTWHTMSHLSCNRKPAITSGECVYGILHFEEVSLSLGMNFCRFSSRGQNDQGKKWPGDEMTGDEMTGVKMYEGTKWPGRNDRVRNERGRSVMPPFMMAEGTVGAPSCFVWSRQCNKMVLFSDMEKYEWFIFSQLVDLYIILNIFSFVTVSCFLQCLTLSQRVRQAFLWSQRCTFEFPRDFFNQLISITALF
jgi:hypothetical protein